MSFWVWIDDSIALSELLVGAAVATSAALLAELVQYQAAAEVKIRFEWLAPALKLPGAVLRDTAIVFAVLWRRLVRGEEPQSGFRRVATRWGDDTPEAVTRRALLVVANSLAPNTLSLGIDPEEDVMIVHHLVLPTTEKRPRKGAGKSSGKEP